MRILGRQFLVAALLLSARVASGAELYVNAKSGSNANDGLSKETAKLTIQAAIDAAPSNSVIHVAAGRYSPIKTTGRNELTILADEGPLVTSIDGDWTERCAHLRTDDNAFYRGNDKIEGFTLLHGRTYDKGGAGVYFGTVSRCIVRNCIAPSGGGGISGSLVVDSLVYGNSSDDSGSQIFNSTVYNTTIAEVYGKDGCVSYGCYLFNCLVFGDVVDGEYGTHESSLILSKADRALYADKDFVPYSDSTNIVGSGLMTYVRGEKDLLGNPRTTGGKVNLGCYQSTALRPADNIYVDASRPDDTGDGLTPESAYRTIAAALERVADGGTIHVAPGVYEGGILRGLTDEEEEEEDLPTVNFVSTEGPEKTILVGEQCYPAALLLDGDRLTGFTLTGGAGTVSPNISVGGVSGGTAGTC